MSKIVLNPNADLKLPLDDLGNNNQTNMFGFSNPNNTLGNNSNINGVSYVNDFANTTNLQQRNFEKEVPNYDFLNNYNQFYDDSNYENVPNLESNSTFDNFIFVIVLIFFVVSIFLLVYFVLRYFNVSLF